MNELFFTSYIGNSRSPQITEKNFSSLRSVTVGFDCTFFSLASRQPDTQLPSKSNECPFKLVLTYACINFSPLLVRATWVEGWMRLAMKLSLDPQILANMILLSKLIATRQSLTALLHGKYRVRDCAKPFLHIALTQLPSSLVHNEYANVCKKN